MAKRRVARKRNTGRMVHVRGSFGGPRDYIDTYKTLWEDRETGRLFIVLYGEEYESDEMGRIPELMDEGFSTCIG